MLYFLAIPGICDLRPDLSPIRHIQRIENNDPEIIWNRICILHRNGIRRELKREQLLVEKRIFYISFFSIIFYYAHFHWMGQLRDYFLSLILIHKKYIAGSKKHPKVAGQTLRIGVQLTLPKYPPCTHISAVFSLSQRRRLRTKKVSPQCLKYNV